MSKLKQESAWFWGASALTLALYLLFPGDVWWINDEPLLFQEALRRNAEGKWLGLGITGGNGNPYGPVPIMLYQLALWVTTDLPVIIFLKSLLGWLVVFFSLLKISRQLGLPRYVIPLAFLSPLVYLYLRVPWDNVFLIPLSAFYFASTLGYLRKGKLSDLLMSMLAAVLMYHVHLMALFLIVPGGILTLLKVAKKRSSWKVSLPTVCFFASLCIPYTVVLLSRNFSEPYGSLLWGDVAASPVIGARILTFVGFFPYFHLCGS